MLNGIVNILRRNLYRAWKVASIATSLASLLLFSIFFLYMAFGYTVYLLEPNSLIAGMELCLCLSAVTFQLKSLKSPNPLKVIWKYPYLSLAILQYLDFISSLLDKLSDRGHELNPIFNFTWYFLIGKLIIFPALLILVQIYFPKNHFAYLAKVLLIIYLIVVVSNFLGALGL